MSFVKDNGGLLSVGAVVWVVTLGFLEWRASVHASDALAAAGIVPEATITAMKDDIEDNEEDIKDLTSRWNNLVDAVAAIGKTE